MDGSITKQEALDYFFGLGEDEVFFLMYKAHIIGELDGVSKACEEREHCR